jgi:hypothetical protein
VLEAIKAWQGRSMPQGWCDANLDSFCAHRRQRCAGRDEVTDSEIHSGGKRCATLANSLTKKAPYKGLGADSEEKREPVSDIDTAVVDSLKALDPKRPIREADLWNLQSATDPYLKNFPKNSRRGCERAIRDVFWPGDPGGCCRPRGPPSSHGLDPLVAREAKR